MIHRLPSPTFQNSRDLDNREGGGLSHHKGQKNGFVRVHRVMKEVKFQGGGANQDPQMRHSWVGLWRDHLEQTGWRSRSLCA